MEVEMEQEAGEDEMGNSRGGRGAELAEQGGSDGRDGGRDGSEGRYEGAVEVEEQSWWGKAGVKVEMENEMGVKDNMGDSRAGGAELLGQGGGEGKDGGRGGSEGRYGGRE